jgi:hypothetical protein
MSPNVRQLCPQSIHPLIQGGRIAKESICYMALVEVVTRAGEKIYIIICFFRG